MLKLHRVLLFLLLAASAAAQSTGTVRGVLTDDSGAVIPAASVSLTGNGSTHSAQTQADGTYTFTGLAPGQYTVHVAFPGFESVDKPVSVRAGGNVQVPIQLSVVAEKQQVTVSSEAGPMVSVDPDANQAQLVLKGDDLDALPDDPDDLSDALQALAGPGAGPEGGSIYIDGFTGGQLPPKDSIREIRINSNPFSPEFDRLGFGRIQIFTKPGADKVRGTVMYNDTESIFNSRNPLSFGGPGIPAKPDFSRRTFFANIGGPLNHKTSYFIEYNRRMINDNAIVQAVYYNPANLASATSFGLPIQQSVVTPNTRNEVSPRLDYQLTKNITLTGRVQYSWYEIDNTGIGQQNLPAPYAQMGYNYTGSQFNTTLTETAVLSSRLMNETRFQYYGNNTRDSGTNLLPSINVSGSFVAGGNDLGTAFNTTHHYEIQNLSTYVRGAHQVKWGTWLRRNSTLTESESGFGGSFNFLGLVAPTLDANNQPVVPNMTVAGCATTPAACSQITSLEQYRRTLLFQGMGMAPAQIQALGGMPSQFQLQTGIPYGSVAIYDIAPWVSDDWKIKPNFTLSLGLRYEWQSGISDDHDIAPRIGFAWSPDATKGGQGKTVIRGGFGIFYDRVNTSLFLNQLELNGSYQLNYTVQNPLFFQTTMPAGGWGSVAPLSLQQNTTYFIDPKLRATSMLQSAIGVERQLPHNSSVSVYYTHTDGTHLAQTVPINSPDPYYGDLRPYGDALGNRFEYEDGGLMRQNMIMMNFNTRATNNLSLQGNYSFSRANCVSGTPSDPYNFGLDWGTCAFNRTNRLFTGGTYIAPLRLRLSPFVVIQSGSPYNVTLGRDLYGDTVTNARPALASGPGPSVISTPYGYFNTNPSLTGPFAPYDYLTTPGLVSVNLRISRTFGFGPPRNGNAMRPGGGYGGGPRGGGGGGGRGMGGPMGGRGAFLPSDLTEHRFNLTVSLNVQNVLNHFNPGGYMGIISSPQFGQPTSTNVSFGGGGGGGGGRGGSGNAADNRLVELGMRLQF